MTQTPVITACPQCGCQLDMSCVYGRFLHCPACRCDLLYQEGIVSMADIVFFNDCSSDGEFREKAVELIGESNIDADRFASAGRVTYFMKGYLPFVEIVNNDGQEKLLPAISEEDKEWHINGLLSFDGVKALKSKQGAQDPNLSRKVDVSAERVELLRGQSRYVADTVMMLPVRSVTFEVDGDSYSVVECDGEVKASFPVGEKQASGVQKKEGSGVLSNLLCFLIAACFIVLFGYCWKWVAPFFFHKAIWNYDFFRGTWQVVKYFASMAGIGFVLLAACVKICQLILDRKIIGKARQRKLEVKKRRQRAEELLHR